MFVDNPLKNSLDNEDYEMNLIKRIFNLNSEKILVDRLGDRININVL